MIRTLAAALATTTCVMALATPAAAQTREYNIPAGSLKAALDAYVRQSGRQVVYRADEVRSARSPGVRGSLSTDAALAALLAGSGFTTRVDGELVAIVKAGNGNAASSPASSGDASPAAGETEARGTVAARPSAQEPAIVVVGSRLRSGNGASPVDSFNREEIRRLGASTVSDVLRYLPQQALDARQSSGSAFAQLRGLPVDFTTVLIDGRRTFPTVSGGNGLQNAFDLNTIPLTAVERVEVLSDTASAAYGADAIGGVVNIVLRQNVTHPVVDIQFGTSEGGADDYRVSAGAGIRADAIRSHVFIDFYRHSFLLGEDRPLTSSGDFREFGGADFRTTFTNPANVCSASGLNLPGLNAPCAVVPENSSGRTLTTGDFLPTAGLTNRQSLANPLSLLPKSERLSVLGLLEIDLGSSFTAAADVLFVDRRETTQSIYNLIANGTVPATNPFNPFGVPVRVGYALTSVGAQRNVSESDTLRTSVAVRGSLDRWDIDTSYVYSRERTVASRENVAVPALVTAALNSADPATSLNVFQDGPPASAAFLETLLAPVRQSELENLSEGHQAIAFGRGPIAELPAGDLDLVVGGEFRSERLLFNGFGRTTRGSRSAWAAFGEARLPIFHVGNPQGGAPVHELYFTAAARYDRYRDFGGSFNYQLGAVWQAAPRLRLRGSYGTAFRPPSLYQLNLPPVIGRNFVVQDPRRGNETVAITTTNGGNSDLRPVRARSLVVGGDYEIAAQDGLRLSASYWRIEIRNRVSSFAPQLILDFEGTFPENVVRALPSENPTSDPFPNVGRLTEVNRSFVNFGKLEVDGVDASLSMGRQFGSVRAQGSIGATWVNSYRELSLPSLPVVERAGNTNPFGNVPEWKAVATSTISGRLGSVSAVVRYVSGFQEANSAGVSLEREIGDEAFVDLQSSVEIGEILAPSSPALRGLRATFGIINVFNNLPNFSLGSGLLGIENFQGDVRGRYGYIRLSKQF